MQYKYLNLENRFLWLLIFTSVSIGLFCIVVYFFYIYIPHLVVIKDDGFHPSSITITEGETITFRSETGEAFWPASNAHPSHTNYPDFDPKKPIGPDETWSYTFTQAGTYGFHDHIKSIFDGEIVVLKKDGTKVVADCSKEKTQQCWEKRILDILKIDGVKAAFDTIVTLSETESGFANDCHALSHLIGEKAYAQYVAKENFELTPATSLCGYGFYHGFMETMLLATGDIDEARAFCELVDQKLRGQASAASTACYHGTGHGAIDGSDPTAWGDIDAMMEPGFKICEKMAQNELQTYLCDTGVFNAIEILSADPKYGITEFRNDPFVMCNRQLVSRREGCYANMIPILFQTYNNDFQAILDYVNSRMIDADVIAIDGHTVNDLTVIDVMVEYIRIHGEESDYAEKGITFCRAQTTDDKLPCIEGISGGHIKYGKPGVEYVKNLSFCAHSMMTYEETDACYKYTLPRLSNRYNPTDTQMICAKVPVQYKDSYCPTL